MPATQAQPRELTDRIRMGQQLRDLRKQRKITLRSLSDASGVALSTLSKMELGQVSISYEKFVAVSHALGVDIGQLFSGAGPEPRGPASAAPMPFAHGDLAGAPSYDTGNYDYRLLAGNFPGRHMTPMHGRILARRREQFDDYIRHPGQEFVMVLSGAVTLLFETGESIALKPRQYAYFDSGIGHIYLSTGRRAAEIMVVMTEP